MCFPALALLYLGLGSRTVSLFLLISASYTRKTPTCHHVLQLGLGCYQGWDGLLLGGGGVIIIVRITPLLVTLSGLYD